MSRRGPGRRTLTATLAALGAAALWLALGHGTPHPRPTRVDATLSVTEALGGASTGFARATTPRPLVFPADHGPHPTFRTEWWYYTGNLRAADGRRFGFQLTFFRTALAPEAPARASEWGSTQVYLAHFALTDVGGGRFHAFSSTARQALGLAGAQALPFRVWVHGWSAEGSGDGIVPVRLRAARDGVGIDLALDSAKPVVLQGERGLSRKGPEPGNASYYYSLTRMPARGVVELGAERIEVDGLAWMDREWSTSALGRDVVGWDWFALQLANGRELMVYRLRQSDGRAAPFSAGSLIERDGTATQLARDAVVVDVLGDWQSPRSGVRYPSRWRLGVPAFGVTLEVTPALSGQELLVGPRYWEGAVEVRGTDHGRVVNGHGYVELVGYGEADVRDGASGSR